MHQRRGEPQLKLPPGGSLTRRTFSNPEGSFFLLEVEFGETSPDTRNLYSASPSNRENLRGKSLTFDCFQPTGRRKAAKFSARSRPGLLSETHDPRHDLKENIRRLACSSTPTLTLCVYTAPKGTVVLSAGSSSTDARQLRRLVWRVKLSTAGALRAPGLPIITFVVVLRGFARSSKSPEIGF